MKIKTYKNNLRLIVNTKKDINLVSFKIFVCVGAKDENEEELGYAHFLEHMFFKSTKQTNAQNILKKLDDLGATKNAYTSLTNTCYYFKCLSSKLKECVETYSEMFFDAKLDKTEIDKEKQVIIEEYKMGQDDPIRKCINNAYNVLFNSTTFGHSVIGTEKTINSVTSQKLKAFKKRLYTPEKIVISVSGNVSFKTVDALIKKFFISKFTTNTQKDIYQIDKYLELKPKAKTIFSKKDNEQSVIFILHDLKNQPSRQRKAYKLLYSILGAGMSSKFFEIIRSQKGLVYSIDASSEKIGNNYIGEILFATSNQKVEEALKEIKKIINDAAQGNIKQEELIRAKNKIISSLEFLNESNSSIAEGNALDLIEYQKVIPDKEVINEYNQITLREVIDCAIQLNKSKSYVVSSVGNHDKKILNLF